MEFAERPHPVRHLAVPLTRRGERLAPKNAVLIVDHGGNVHILVGINAGWACMKALS